MSDETKPSDLDQQPVSGVKDERAAHKQTRKDATGGGVNGPVEKDRLGYKTHYGETAYGGGQTRYDGQPPVSEAETGSRRNTPRREGKAGSKATMPGAGADHGPPDES
jgi:hypothetical protein